MKLGVPTLRHYELLDRLIESAERGTVKPSGYIIIDNGGSYNEDSRMASGRGIESERITVIRPGKNLGVAASWNLMLERAGDEPIAIANDDMTLGPETFGAMQEAVTRAPFALLTADWRWPWILFAQTPECTRRVGFYDENFFPAYWEDLDYKRRIKMSGIAVEHVNGTHTHVGSASAGSAEARRGHEYGAGYYRKKWGGPPGVRDGWHAHGRECFSEPFNGTPPPGWTLRNVAEPWRIPLPRRSIIDYMYQR